MTKHRGVDVINSAGNGKVWIVDNIIRNVGHSYVINCKSGVTCFIKNNIHSNLETTGPIVTDEAKKIVCNENIADNEMYME